MRNKLYIIIAALAAVTHAQAGTADSTAATTTKSTPLQWRLGAEVSPAVIPGTSAFLKGNNPSGRPVDASFSTSVRADFRFAGGSQRYRMYRDVYQGIGIQTTTFANGSQLGSPVSVYVYQGMPVARIGRRVTLDCEWQFGAAFGWKHYSDIQEALDANAAVSTAVTAHMGVALKLRCDIGGGWQVSAGAEAKHYSNGNTQLPNAGVNSLGAAAGLAYTFGNTPSRKDETAEVSAQQNEEKGKHRFYDITAYGAWRKRVIDIEGTRQLCQGKFGVAGLQLAAMHRLTHLFAAGAAVDLQYDESGGLPPYRVEWSDDENMKFYRPPFFKQLSAGLSAHAELTMPIFSVNVGLGYDIISPVGNERFFQSLTLKTFVNSQLFLNVGYRLGNFKDPQNLMLGMGVRL